MGGTSRMTPIATLKADPTPELIREILARAAADGADGLVIHLPQICEDEISFLYVSVEFPNLTSAISQSYLSD